MQKIKVCLIGRPYVEVDGERINFPYKKAEGLFYYLCVRKTATREEIISILWGADAENVGRKNLREAVYQIKKLFGKEILIAAGHTNIALNPEAMIDVDWDRFMAEEVLENNEEEFLAHYYVKNSYEFEEWITSMQEQYNELFLKNAKQRFYRASEAKDTSEIQRYSNILIKHDPYDEKLYHEIMEIYAVNGHYNMAIKLYYDLRKILREDLNVEPSTEMTALFHRIFNVKENLTTKVREREKEFFGRTKEIYQINEYLSESNKGDMPHGMAIAGESGIGKSALLEKGRQMVGGYQMLSLFASCSREEKDFFLRPWHDIFREIMQYRENGSLENLKQEEKLLKRIFGGTAFVENEGETGHISYQIIEETVLDLFEKATKGRRIALFFDDIQWMDPMSVRLLNRILLTFGTEKIVLLCTFRKNDETTVLEALAPLFKRDWIKVLWLECFTKEETDTIIHTYLPELDSDPRKRENIYNMTEGNVFFLMELINIIKEKGYTLEMSRKTINVIKSRLIEVPEEENQILDCLSVFPDKVSVEELELLLPMDRLHILCLLEKLQGRHLAREILVGWNVYYCFVHRVFKEYVYDRQSMGKKALYHEILAKHYEDEFILHASISQVPMIIYHYERCHNLQKTYQYRIQYVKEYYTCIHENFPVLHLEMEYSTEAWGITTGAEEMIQLAEEVIQWKDDSSKGRELKMEMHYIMGRYGIAFGEYKDGIAHIQDAISLAEGLKNRDCLLNSYKQMIFYGIQVEEIPLVKEYVNKGLSMIEPQREPDEYGVFLRLKGWYQVFEHDYDQGKQTLEESLEVFQNEENTQERYSMSIAACYNYMGDSCRYQENYEEALEYYQLAIKTGAGKAITNGLGQFYSNAGQMFYQLGRYEEAGTYLMQATQCFYKYGYCWGLGRAEAYLALLMFHEHKLDKAVEHYEKAVEAANKIKNPQVLNLVKYVKSALESCK